jgi:hypothetical protein
MGTILYIVTDNESIHTVFSMQLPSEHEYDDDNRYNFSADRKGHPEREAQLCRRLAWFRPPCARLVKQLALKAGSV